MIERELPIKIGSETLRLSEEKPAIQGIDNEGLASTFDASVKGATPENPYYGSDFVSGNYVDIISEIDRRGDCLYLGINEGVIHIDSVNKILTPVSVGHERMMDYRNALMLILTTHSLGNQLRYNVILTSQFISLRYAHERTSIQ